MSQDERDDEPQGLERVPDPFKAQLLADLPPPDEPSPRNKRLAAACVLVDQGSTLTQAAKDCDIPLTTLWRYYHKYSAMGGQTRDWTQKAEEDIRDLAIAGTLKASSNLYERLEQGTMRPAEEIKAMQVFRDTARILLGWDGTPSSDDAAGSALVKALLELRGKRVTIEDEAPDAKAIDVQASSGD